MECQWKVSEAQPQRENPAVEAIQRPLWGYSGVGDRETTAEKGLASNRMDWAPIDRIVVVNQSIAGSLIFLELRKAEGPRKLRWDKKRATKKEREERSFFRLGGDKKQSGRRLIRDD